jgi:outer membrane receptor protein involved in Fe transport
MAAQQPSPASQTEAQSPSPAADDAPSDIIVTGSRLVTNGNQAPTPVTVLGAADLATRAPSNIPDALNQLPQFQGSNSTTQTNIANPSSATLGNNLNLRNLGAVRALTLFDSMRLPPSSGSGLIDANLVPQLLIQRVDIVTGGASAAYGSDAVSGVINFVLDKRFTGVRYVAQAGVSSRGDAASQRIGAAFGTSLLDGKLHLEGSAEFYNNDGIGALTDRPFGAGRFVVVGSACAPTTAPTSTCVGGSAANPFVTVAFPSSSSTSFDGYFLNGPLANRTINSTGAVVPFSGTTVGAGVCVNCNTGYHDPATVTLVAPLRTKQFFGRAEYTVSDSLLFFAQGIYSRSDSSYNATTPTIRAGAATQLTIFNDNAFLPASVAAQLAGTPSSAFAIQARGLGVQAGNIQTETIAAFTGAEGSFGGGWKWDASYSYGRSKQDYSVSNPNNVRLRAALDAVRDPANGNIVCRVTLTNPGLYPGCAPINLFGEQSASPAAVAYVSGLSTQQSVNDQHVVAANVRGDLFSLWAGPISLAVGAEYRRQTLSQTGNSDPTAPISATGIRGFAGFEYVSTNLANGRGEVTVKEGYGELLIPLAKDMFLARSLDLNLAARYTDYSTSGGVTTWKVGGNWEPFDGLRFRVTRSRDIRAPTLFELFSGQTPAQQAFTDPRTGGSGATIQITGSNPDLRPEKADTLTAGFVVQPDFIPGFSVSLDFYRIKIADAIASPFSITQIAQVCEASGGTDPLCAFITRPLPFSDRSPANYPTSVRLLPVNVASVLTEGFDLEVNYRREMLGGDVSIRALATYLTKYNQIQAPGRPATILAGNSDISDRFGGLPNFRGTASISYQSGPFKAQVTERVVGSSVRSRTTFFVDNDVPGVAYTDLDLSFDTTGTLGDMQFFTNVANLFDRQPPLIASSANPGLVYPTYRGLFDVVGRTFTLGVRGKF